MGKIGGRNVCSEKKRLANQQNALKSTGPKTPEGKARSRQNALKHGLTGDGTVLPPDEVELYHERIDGWTFQEKPKGELDQYLLGCAVLASIRVDRAARLDLAAVAERREQTVHEWACRQKRRIKRAVKLLDEDPARAVERLSRMRGGCSWLLERWD
jgi:hypothetical protein